MQILKRILVWLFVIITIIASGLYIFIQVQGKDLIEEKLTLILDRDVVIDDVRFVFPLGLRIDNLDVPGILHAKEARVQIGFPVILGRDFVISNLVLNEPAIVFHRTKDSKIRMGEILEDTAPKQNFLPKKAKPVQGVKKSRSRPLGLIIDHLEVNNGQVDFSDQSLGKDLNIKFVDINLKSHAFSYPLKSVKTKYFLSAMILNDSAPFSGSRIESDGWVNFFCLNA